MRHFSWGKGTNEMNEIEKLAALAAEAARAKALASHLRQTSTIDTSFGEIHCRWERQRLFDEIAIMIEAEIEDLYRSRSRREGRASC